MKCAEYLANISTEYIKHYKNVHVIKSNTLTLITKTLLISYYFLLYYIYVQFAETYKLVWL